MASTLARLPGQLFGNVRGGAFRLRQSASRGPPARHRTTRVWKERTAARKATPRRCPARGQGLTRAAPHTEPKEGEIGHFRGASSTGILQGVGQIGTRGLRKIGSDSAQNRCLRGRLTQRSRILALNGACVRPNSCGVKPVPAESWGPPLRASVPTPWPTLTVERPKSSPRNCSQRPAALWTRRPVSARAEAGARAPVSPSAPP